MLRPGHEDVVASAYGVLLRLYQSFSSAGRGKPLRRLDLYSRDFFRPAGGCGAVSATTRRPGSRRSGQFERGEKGPPRGLTIGHGGLTVSLRRAAGGVRARGRYRDRAGKCAKLYGLGFSAALDVGSSGRMTPA